MITVRVTSQRVADSLKVPGLPMLVAPLKHQTGKDGNGEESNNEGIVLDFNDGQFSE